MARGFESKQVESQQQDREARSERARNASRDADLGLKIADPVVAAARHSLELAKARAEHDLANVSNAAHRAMLFQTIAAINARLEQL